MKQLKISNSITKRESLSVEKYLQELSREGMISVDDEITLAQRIQEGSHEAWEKMTLANLRFVVSVAKQYQNQGIPLCDLISEGNIGLMRAAKRFDSTRGFKFISYAVWWIRQAVMQSLAEQGRLVRLPLNQVGAQSKVNKAIRHFMQSYERNPSVGELAEALDLPLEKIYDTINVSGGHISLDAPFVEGEENSLLDVLADNDEPETDHILMNESLSHEIERVLNTLTEREREILRFFFGIGRPQLSLEEIAGKFNLTRERVRQIKERSIRHLRCHSKCKNLKVFLG